jgi:hypothetical protein
MNPFSNYTGAYLSDGKFQPSVAYGKQRPNSELDKFSRFHDTMYARYPDRRHRRAADMWYHDNVPDDLLSSIAGDLVWYGNRAIGFMSDPIDELSGSVDQAALDTVSKIPVNDPFKGTAVYTPQKVPAPKFNDELLFLPNSGIKLIKVPTSSTPISENSIDLSYYNDIRNEK